MERIEAPRGGERVDEEAPGDARVKPHERLPELLSELPGASAARRAEVAGLFNEALIAMRAPGDEAQEAAALVAQLDAGLLAQLVDARGRSCRKEAVETLLSLGYPHALSVRPEDLVFARRWRPTLLSREKQSVGEWVRVIRGTRRAAAGIVALGQVVNLGLLSWGSLGVAGGLALMGALASGLIIALMASAKPSPSNQAGPLTALTFATLALLAAGLGGLPGALVGAGANVLAALVVLIWQYQPAGPQLEDSGPSLRGPFW